MIENAACAGDLTFTERPYAEQRPICFRCPVRVECLEGALGEKTSEYTRAGLRPDQLAKLRGLRKASVVAVCRGCGAEFLRASNRQVHCSVACRQAWSNRRRDERRAVAS
ncbi:MAG: hypothetical protein CVT66_06155 [Actinobacteria bacterium HGW-Actinobacteria-6]|nr:MAG: hypothetical protein CVT66_06155 [Actinobacteria bacterium HGW-Actinobacteria-6]